MVLLLGFEPQARSCRRRRKGWVLLDRAVGVEGREEVSWRGIALVSQQIFGFWFGR